MTMPPIAARPVALMMPAASRSPSSASERWNVRSMSIAATENAPAKKPNTTKPAATGRNVERTPESRAAPIGAGPGSALR